MAVSSQPSVGAEQNNDLRLFSCTICRQRKVKCDRCDPCSSCVKSGVPCTFVSPAPSRRRKRKAAKEGLHARLRRYERILQSYGAVIDASGMEDQSEESAAEDEMEIVPGDDVADAVKPEQLSTEKNQPKEAKLYSQQGKSRYIETDLWSTLTKEINDPSHLLNDDSDEDSAEAVFSASIPLDENALLLGMSNKQNLNALHPQKDVLLRLWGVFQENINPMIKLIHVPSFQRTIDAFCVSPLQVSRSIEAMLFVIYFAAVASLSDDECVQTLGEPKKTVFSRYRNAAQQALVNARFLQSTSLVTLQAYYIFLVSAPLLYGTSTLLCLSGVAVRIARRLGLHRDGVSLGLRPFEVEMRRRLWWQISYFEFRAADFCGSRPSLDLQCDTRSPLNVNDSDLSPDMKDAPKERPGITEMVFCLLRRQIGDFLARVASPMSFDCLRRSSMTLFEKDQVIDRLQDSLEQKFLRHCDPLQPIHLMSSIFCRSAICKLRLSVHNPFPNAGQNESISESEGDLIFENGTKVIEYGNMLHSAPSLQRFRWLLGSNFSWDSFIYTLIELRRRKNGPEVDRAWSQIAEMFESYPQAIKDTSNPLYVAVGIWTLKVWEECYAAREGAAPFKTPDFITQLRRNSTKLNRNSETFHSAVPIDPSIIGGNLFGYERLDYLNQPSDMAMNTTYGDLDSPMASDMLFLPPFSVDWAQLDPMARGE